MISSLGSDRVLNKPPLVILCDNCRLNAAIGINVANRKLFRATKAKLFPNETIYLSQRFTLESGTPKEHNTIQKRTIKTNKAKQGWVLHGNSFYHSGHQVHRATFLDSSLLSRESTLFHVYTTTPFIHCYQAV